MVTDHTHASMVFPLNPITVLKAYSENWLEIARAKSKQKQKRSTCGSWK